jgi:transcriptional regulator with XRE-family HTH domain
MDDLRLGLALRAARLKRRLRQSDLATLSGISTSLVSRLEQGDVDRLSLRALRSVAAKVGVSLEIVPRSPGSDLDRLVNARHAALGEAVAAWVARQPGWVVAAEVSFNIYGERGIVDLLAWHEATGSLVVIEFKTAIVDVDELLGTLDRKVRLAGRIALGRGWTARFVSAWLIVGDSRTNRRRVADHRTVLRSALPRDGRSIEPLFLHPGSGPVSGIVFWSNLPGVKVGRVFAAQQRVASRSGSAVRRSHAQDPVRGPAAE